MYDQERNIIACLLQGIGTHAFEILTLEDFSVYGRIFDYLDKQHRKSKPVDFVQVAKKCEIPIAEVAQISASALPSAFDGCIESVKSESAKRQYNRVMQSERKGDIDEVIDAVIYELQAINLYKTSKSRDMPTIAMDYMELLGERQKNAGRELKSGIPKLDRTLGGFHKKEFTIIGARPSVGKSAFGLQVACNIAKANKVLFVSLEMADVQIMERLIARYGKVQHSKLKTGNLTDDEIAGVWVATDEVGKLNLKIDTSIRTVGQLRTKILSDRPDIVIVDYLGLLSDNSRKFRDKREEMSSITHKIKAMALDYDIPIIGLAQLGRSAQDRKPMLSELRDSGSLEEDADNVIFIHRLTEKDEEYCLYTDENAQPVMLMVEKQRNGENVWIKCVYFGNKFMFVEEDGIRSGFTK